MTDDKGGEVILATLAAGDYIGEMSMIDSEPHCATVSVDMQTDMLVLGRDDFSRCLIDNAPMGYAVMRGLVRRLRGADNQIGSLALMGVSGRVANVLLEARLPAEDGHRLIRDKISRKDLAKMVGASREMVSRVMKDFEEQGFVQTLDGGVLRVVERRSVAR
jgi:CRP-like cAMP-binding protein